MLSMVLCLDWFVDLDSFVRKINIMVELQSTYYCSVGIVKVMSTYSV